MVHHVDVLDTAGATHRLLGNGALYLRMLRRFAADHPPGRQAIRAAFASADLSQAHRLAHTLKGSAGMIGAHLLHGHASSLEQQLRTAGLGGAVAALQALELALAETLLAVGRVLDGATVDGQTALVVPAIVGDAGSASRRAAEAAVQQLARLLDLGDGAALDVLETTGPACKALLGAAAYSEVMLAVHAFHFEAALLAIRKAAPGLVGP